MAHLPQFYKANNNLAIYHAHHCVMVILHPDLLVFKSLGLISRISNEPRLNSVPQRQIGTFNYEAASQIAIAIIPFSIHHLAFVKEEARYNEVSVLEHI